jgi:hypothetical protein
MWLHHHVMGCIHGVAPSSPGALSLRNLAGPAQGSESCIAGAGGMRVLPPTWWISDTSRHVHIPKRSSQSESKRTLGFDMAFRTPLKCESAMCPIETGCSGKRTDAATYCLYMFITSCCSPERAMLGILLGNSWSMLGEWS